MKWSCQLGEGVAVLRRLNVFSRIAPVSLVILRKSRICNLQFRKWSPSINCYKYVNYRPKTHFKTIPTWALFRPYVFPPEVISICIFYIHTSARNFSMNLRRTTFYTYADSIQHLGERSVGERGYSLIKSPEQLHHWLLSTEIREGLFIVGILSATYCGIAQKSPKSMFVWLWNELLILFSDDCF